MADVLVLLSPKGKVPLATLAALRLWSGSVSASLDLESTTTQGVSLIMPDGEALNGESTVLRYIGRLAAKQGAYGPGDAVSAARVDEYLAVVDTISRDESILDHVLKQMNARLALDSFLVGYVISIADTALWAVLAMSRRWTNSFIKQEEYCNIARWYNFINSYSDTLAVSKEYNPLVKEAENRAAEKDRKMADIAARKAATGSRDVAPDLVLPGAEEGKVVTRFPPEPSGFLHIGHAKAALLNMYFAERYKGKCLIRFDDTNPSKEKDEFVENIKKDLETLQVKAHAISFTSDYFEKLRDVCIAMIKAGKFYVDNTPTEKMREERGNGTDSVNRNASPEQSLQWFEEMLVGSEFGTQCCVRAKINMQHKNKCMRDPVMYRCNLIPHHRTGTKYKAYPTYDLACPYVDSVEGVTHALRSSEYHDRNELYDWMLDALNVRKVFIWDFSRMNLTFTLLSKRKLQWFVDKGYATGWDDPRFPTVQGMMRRGLTYEALKQFIIAQGASKNYNLMDWDKIWSFNKKVIDPVCPRHTGIIEEKKIPFYLSNGPEKPEMRVMPKHKKHPPTGNKITTYSKSVWVESTDALVTDLMSGTKFCSELVTHISLEVGFRQAMTEGEEVTLMDWGNAFVHKIIKNDAGNVERLEGELHLEGDFKKTKLKIHWLPMEGADLVNLLLVDFDYIITKKKIEEEDDFETFVNLKTKIEASASGDANLRSVKKGDILQLERKGFFICDSPFLNESNPLTLFFIPDGRARAPPVEYIEKREW